MPILAILTTPLETANGQAINQTKKQMEMKKIFFVAIGIACLMASCTKDSTIEQPKVNPFAGREVIFSTNADDNSSRTIYGEEIKTETDGTITSWYYPVYWKTGDQILVYGKDSKTKATYDVNVTSDGTQNYANSLDKVEANGVQWGENATSDFFAVYPAKGASFNEDGSINTTIAQTQYNVFSAAEIDEDGNVVGGWVGQPFDTDATNPTMTNAIMYAYTKDASAYELDENGNIKTDANGDPIPNQKVELNFKPFSTVLKFRLAGFSSNLESETIVNVTKITITAPNDYRISGDFTVTPTVTDGTVSATAEASTSSQNTIEIIPIISTGTYLPITVGQYVEFNVFAMPIANQQILASGNWTVKVETAMHGNYTCTLKPTEDKTLAPGKIHKIAVPAITSLNTVEWDYSKWMTQIPKPVYLSELSVPGTWYTNDSDYQATTDLATLYAAGIRAFNIDCRISKKDCNDAYNGNYLKAEKAWTDTDYTDGKGYLACAGTEPTPTIGFSDYQNLPGEGTYVSTVISDIITIAQKHPDEYVYIVVTFAEKPLTNSGVIFGTVRPDYITTELKTILETEGIKEYIYTGITKDTTIEDVLTSGKNVIVKINHSNVDFATSTSPSFDMPDGVMASFASMAQSGYISTGVTDIILGIADSSSNYYGYYSQMQEYPIYNGKTATDMTFYYHQAQRTTDDDTQGVTTYTSTPTLGNRMDAIDNIIEKATEIYDRSDHNAWYQIAIGGSIDGDNPAGVSPLVTYLKEKIDDKAMRDPSPVGIVLMNHATTTGAELVKSIIDMNAKFYLKREGGDITTGGGSSSGGGTEGGGDEGGTGGEGLPEE